MAVVQGIREKVHNPIYDCLTVEPEAQLRDEESSGTLRFFVNVQGKTKLQTNLQSASLLPHYNTFEARAMRVVMSDLPPQFATDVDVEFTDDDEIFVTDENGLLIDNAGVLQNAAGFNANLIVVVNYTTDLANAMDLLSGAQDSGDDAQVDLSEDGVELKNKDGSALTAAQLAAVSNAGVILLSEDDLSGAIDNLDNEAPADEQISPGNGSGNVISTFIYNTVTTFYVGEKIMIQMPTWFFPGGAGPYSQTEKGTTHGEPSPLATFRFAEPIFIDRQQNFRVEIEIPDSDVLKNVQKIYGPLFIWVVLDGFMTRGVQ